MLTDKGQQQHTKELISRIEQLERQNRLLEMKNRVLASQQELILDKVPMLYFQVDKAGIFKDIRGKALNLLSESREEVIGMSAFDMGKRWPELGEAVRESLNGKALTKILHTADGQSYHASQVPIKDEQGNFDGFIGVAYDITPYINEEKRSNYKDSFLRFFVKHTPAAIAMFDKDMRYIMYSDRWIEDYRLQDEVADLQGKSHYEVFPDTPQRWREVHQRCLRGVTESCEEDRYERLDGHIDFVNWVVTPWFTEENEVGGLIFFTELVNERVEAYQRQKEMSNAIKLSHQKMQEFVYALSQNLRDPLESALLLVDFIGENLDSSRKNSLPKTVSFLHTHLSRMTRMVGELHEYAGADAKAGKRAVDLSEVVEQVIKNLSLQVPDGDTEISHRGLPTVFANEFEMIALFQHLLGNAIRYYEGKSLKVEISVEKKEGKWQIEVKDNGPGMSEEEQKEVFDLFRQLDADQSLTGTGISLPMSRRIVERMGGQIWVESILGKGTSFFIELPLED